MNEYSPSKRGTTYFNLHFTNKDTEALRLNNLPKVTNWYVTNPGSEHTQV